MSQLRRLLTLASTIVLGAAPPASAQLFEIARTNTKVVSGISPAAAYDPVHDCYLVVSGGGSFSGRFVDRAGRMLGAPFVIGAVPPFIATAVTYSPDVSNGQGGVGGFVAVWNPQNTTTLVAQLVSYPGRLVGLPITIMTGPVGVLFLEIADIAYSPVSKRFLVGATFWTSYPGSPPPSRSVLLNLNAQPIVEMALSLGSSGSCHTVEFFSSCNEVRVVWNSQTNEFGALYREGFNMMLARIGSSGTILSRSALANGYAYTALAINTHTGRYLAAGATGGNSDDLSTTYGAEVDPDGSVVATGLITTALVANTTAYALMDLSYSPATGTFLLIGRGENFQERLIELNQHGVALGSSLVMPGGFFVITSHPTSPEWLVGLGDRTLIMGSSAPFGGSNAQLSGCLTADPFASLGGGRCVNRGWLPPGHPLIPPGPPPPPPPPPPSSGCTIPDPFTSLGGGVCVNGGWVPRGHPLAGGGL
jgi:hypothetical protein